MPKKTLYVEIFQPFAQYRNPFTFYYAQSYPLPPKSTVIGMLQNATNRYYDEQFWELRISIHGGFESHFWNYQQLIKGDVELRKNDGKIELWNQKRPLYGSGVKSQRTPVHQQELFNGRLFLFVKGEESILEDIKDSLEKPKKILSLGRSEDVIFIKKIAYVKPRKNEPEKVKKSLWMTYPTYIMKSIGKKEEKEDFPIKNERYPVYSIPIRVVFKNNGTPIRNKSEITKSTERWVDFATVIHSSYNSAIKLKGVIDVETFVVNGKTFKIPVKWGWLYDNCK